MQGYLLSPCEISPALILYNIQRNLQNKKPHQINKTSFLFTASTFSKHLIIKFILPSFLWKLVTHNTAYLPIKITVVMIHNTGCFPYQNSSAVNISLLTMAICSTLLRHFAATSFGRRPRTYTASATASTSAIISVQHQHKVRVSLIPHNCYNILWWCQQIPPVQIVTW